MTLFKNIKYDLKAAESELNQFSLWLSTAGFVKEKIILREFKKHKNLPCLIGPTGGISYPNLVKWELGLQGLYKTDLALGNHGLRKFLLIEFEGAEENSLFGKTKTVQNRNWSSQLEHGFGQIIDWACVLSHSKHDALIKSNFGGPVQHCAFLVICGRDKGINGPLEKDRLDYRSSMVRIEGIGSQVLTYDQMVVAMQDNLEAWKTVL